MTTTDLFPDEDLPSSSSPEPPQSPQPPAGPPQVDPVQTPIGPDEPLAPAPEEPNPLAPDRSDGVSAAEAEEERLDRETPSALDHLSATAQKFLDDPGIDLTPPDDRSR